jgi:hypothetical protein
LENDEIDNKIIPKINKGEIEINDLNFINDFSKENNNINEEENEKPQIDKLKKTVNKIIDSGIPSLYRKVKKLPNVNKEKEEVLNDNLPDEENYIEQPEVDKRYIPKQNIIKVPDSIYIDNINRKINVKENEEEEPEDVNNNLDENKNEIDNNIYDIKSLSDILQLRDIFDTSVNEPINLHHKNYKKEQINYNEKYIIPGINGNKDLIDMNEFDNMKTLRDIFDKGINENIIINKKEFKKK